MFEELSIVELTKDLKEFNLAKGDTGTIVEIYDHGKAYEVEFVAKTGKTIALITLAPSDIKPFSDENKLDDLHFNWIDKSKTKTEDEDGKWVPLHLKPDLKLDRVSDFTRNFPFT
ncbi:DUF4926 domain-containing protein [Candidatus Gottesmanbacteria bacterium]|nr:DUF4926 domain-containing protein [Candidatus Gottesmanbacteria bacterium]